MLFSSVISGILGKRQLGRVFLEAEIFKKKNKVLYDTGADISCLDEKEFRKIPIDLRPKANAFSTYRQYLSASKDPLVVKGVFDIPIKICGRTIYHPFYVIKNLSDPVILGADFIHEHKLSYCPEKRDFFWSAKKWVTGVATLTTACVLPAFSVASVKVNLHTSEKTRKGQFNMALDLVESQWMTGSYWECPACVTKYYPPRAGEVLEPFCMRGTCRHDICRKLKGDG